MSHKKIQKKAQEELVGFALIIIIVAVILLFLIVFSLRSNEKEAVESSEVNSFIQAFLQYSTDCRDNLEYFSVQDLISECNNEAVCLDERDSCEVLNSTLKNIIGVSWKVGQDRPVKGYDLKITANKREIIALKAGNITRNDKGAGQSLPDSIEVSFRVYS